MSQTIDQKIVQMKFDNRDFEKNVSTSMSTLQKFKESLNFAGASKGLDDLNQAAKKINLNPLSNAADAVGVKMDAMAVASITAIQRIVNAALDAGEKIAKSLTIEPISQGYNEYELKMGSVQTIMASTGASLEEVNGYLEELNKYADQTIYSFSDMTSSIGKFTNAGVPLKDAVAAIQGISNEAALSGANAQQASHAMYNFAQALSSGAVKLIDWKSIENANMATVGFKDELIKTGVELGTLIETEEGYISTTTDMNGRISDAFTSTYRFNDSLSAQWMTTDVLTKTLARYADREEDIGIAAFKAATEVKTFTQLLDTLKEAVGSGWAQSFELIIGDFNQAKQLLTGISNVVGGMIDAQADARNKILEEWQEFKGRDTLVLAFRNIWKGVESVLKPIKEAIATVIPPLTGKRLAELTLQFSNFTAKLKLSADAADGLKNIVTFVLKSFRFSLELFGKLLPVIGGMTGRIFKMAGGFLELFASGNGIPGLLKRIFGNERYRTLAEKYAATVDQLSLIFEKLKNGVKRVIDTFKQSEFVTKTLDDLKAIIDSITTWIYDHLIAAFDALNTYAGGFTDWAYSSFHSLLNIIANFKSPSQAFQSLLDWITEVTSKSQFFVWLGSAIKFVRDHIDNLGRSIMAFIKGTKILSIFKGVRDFLSGVKDRFMEFVKALNLSVIAAYAFSAGILFLIFTLGRLSNAGAYLIKSLTGMFDSISDYFRAKKLESYSKSLLSFSVALAVLTAVLIGLSYIPYDPEKLRNTAIVLGALALALVVLYGAMVKISSMKKEKVYDPRKGIVQALNTFVEGIAKSMKAMAKAIAFKNIAKGIMILIADLVLLGLAIKALIWMDVWGDLTSGGWKPLAAAMGGLLALAIIIRVAGKGALAAGAGVLLLIGSMILLSLLWKIVTSQEGLAATAGEVLLKITKIIMLVVGVIAGIQILSKWLTGETLTKTISGIGKTLIAFSLSLMILAGVLAIMSALAAGDNLSTFLVVTDYLTQLMLIITLMIAVSSLAGKNFNQFGKGMITISVSLLMLTGVLFALTKLVENTAPETLSEALLLLIVFIGIVGALIVASRATEKAKLAPIIGVILLMIVLFGMLTVLSIMPLNGILGAAASLAIVILAIGALFLAISKLKQYKKIGGLLVMFVGVVATILVVGTALATLAALNVDTDRLIGIALAIAMVMVTIAGATMLTNDSLKGAGTMILAALALGVVAVALSLLCTFDWPQIIVAALSLSIVMGVLAVVCNIVKGGIGGAAGLIVASIAVGVLAYALYELAKVPFEQLMGGVLGLSVVILAIAAAMMIFAAAGVVAVGTAPGLVILTVAVFAIAAAMIVGAMAVVLITNAIINFSNHVPSIAANVITLAQAFKIFIDTIASAIDDAGGIGLAIGGALIGGLFGGLTSGFGLIGAGIGALVGMMVDTFRKDTKSRSPSVLFQALGICIPQGIAVGVTDGIPTVGEALSSVGDVIVGWFNNVKGFFSGLFGGAGEESGEKFLGNLSQNVADSDPHSVTDSIDPIIDEYISKLGAGGAEGGGALVNGFSEAMDQIKNSDIANTDWASLLHLDKFSGDLQDAFNFDMPSLGFDNIENTVGTFLGNITQDFDTGGLDSANGFLDTLTTEFDNFDYSSMTGNLEGMMGDFSNVFSLGGTESISEYTNGIGDGERNLVSTINRVGSSGASAMDNYTGDYYTAGENAVTGFVRGSNSKMPDVKKVGLEMAKTFLTSLKEGLTSHSPSRKAMEVGSDTTTGYVLGILNGLKSVSESASEVGATAVTSLVNSIAGLDNAISDDLDVQPVIRPVLDLSEIKQGAGVIDSLVYPTETFKMASINSSMINATLDARSMIPTNDAVVSAINKLHNDFGNLQDSNNRLFDFLDHYIPELSNMQVVMDSGSVVGQLGSRIDGQLGSYTMRQRRQ